MRKPGLAGLRIAVICATTPDFDGPDCFGLRLAGTLQESGHHIADIGMAAARSEAMTDLIEEWRTRIDLDLILISDEAIAAKAATECVVFTREQQASERTARLLRHPDLMYLEVVDINDPEESHDLSARPSGTLHELHARSACRPAS